MAIACMLQPTPAGAIPVFARIYDKPCGTCHTVFPQLNPAGENFRAHGFHGLQPAVASAREAADHRDLRLQQHGKRDLAHLRVGEAAPCDLIDADRC